MAALQAKRPLKHINLSLLVDTLAPDVIAATRSEHRDIMEKAGLQHIISGQFL